METSELIGFVQAVGVPAAFSFALLWIIERRLTVIAAGIERLLALNEATIQAFLRVAESLGDKG